MAWDRSYLRILKATPRGFSKNRLVRRVPQIGSGASGNMDSSGFGRSLSVRISKATWGGLFKLFLKKHFEWEMSQIPSLAEKFTKSAAENRSRQNSTRGQHPRTSFCNCLAAAFWGPAVKTYWGCAVFEEIVHILGNSSLQGSTMEEQSGGKKKKLHGRRFYHSGRHSGAIR